MGAKVKYKALRNVASAIKDVPGIMRLLSLYITNVNVSVVGSGPILDPGISSPTK
uniref:Uncharacterized protein n=1 Tax=Romanomermis culicivorax TaxID=13658 RepID=A0A915L344_ROMCU